MSDAACARRAEGRHSPRTVSRPPVNTYVRSPGDSALLAFLPVFERGLPRFWLTTGAPSCERIRA